MNRIGKLVVILIALLVLSCGSVIAQDEENNQKQAPAARDKGPSARPESRASSWYRIEIAIHELEDGKKINTRNYSMDTEDNGRAGSMKVGSRLPVATSASKDSTQFQYIDVGVDIQCWVGVRSENAYYDGKVGLTTMLDMSSVVDSAQAKNAMPGVPIIRHLRSGTNTALVLGKAMPIASIEDPTLPNRKYTVEATVTKLNP